MIDVVVIILNWNRPDLTLKAFRSLKCNKNINVRVVIADNNSTDDSIGRFLQEPEIDILPFECNYGYAKGYNLAVKYVKEKYNPEYAFLLNNDTVLDSRAIQMFYNNRKKADIITPKIYFKDGKTLWSCGGKVCTWKAFAKNIGIGENDCGQYDNCAITDFASGCAMWFKMDVVNSIGLFDIDYMYYYEDVDFCYKARKHGFSILYLPEAKVIHMVGQSTGNEYSIIPSYYRWRNRIIFARKIMNKLQYNIFILFTMPLVMIRDSFRYLIRGSLKELFVAFRGVLLIIYDANDKK